MDVCTHQCLPDPFFDPFCYYYILLYICFCGSTMDGLCHMHVCGKCAQLKCLSGRKASRGHPCQGCVHWLSSDPKKHEAHSTERTEKQLGIQILTGNDWWLCFSEFPLRLVWPLLGQDNLMQFWRIRLFCHVSYLCFMFFLLSTNPSSPNQFRSDSSMLYSSFYVWNISVSFTWLIIIHTDSYFSCWEHPLMKRKCINMTLKKSQTNSQCPSGQGQIQFFSS